MKGFPAYLLLASGLAFLIACGGDSGAGGGEGPATHFSVSGPSNTPSGNTFNLTVTALDASDHPVSTYSGTVHFTSSDPHSQLAPDSRLLSGNRVFSAVLTTAGDQTITATDSATASIKGTSTSIKVGSLAGTFAVETFGAKGDGHTDDTVAIQNAIQAAAAAGGGSVLFKVARYLTSGTFLVPEGVVLCGAVEGPFDVSGVNPATTTIAPTLLITNTSGPFITLEGDGTGVADLLFHYPNQVKTSASTPKVYPYTIRVNRGMKVVRSTVTNAYNFLDIELGRFMAQNLYIGAFNVGINIDHSYDFVTLHNLHHGIFWDEMENAAYPTPIDSWVLNHGTGLIVNQMDALEIDNFFVFSRAVGITLTFSPDLTEPGIRTGWGTGSDIDLEMVQYGIIADATNQPGFEFTNVQVRAAPGLGQAAIQLRGGGTNPPDVIINGGSARGTWALGAFPPPAAGYLTVINTI
jgi:Pectate lyase superfamily protein